MTQKSNWASILAEWSASGKSKKQFCEERGLRYQNFMYHHKRALQAEGISGFQRVRFDTVPQDVHIEYHFGDGRKVSFPIHTPKEFVRFLIGL